MLYEVTELRSIINNLKVTNNNQQKRFVICSDEKNKINSIREKILCLSQMWDQLSKHICLLSNMDTGSYAQYRQSILGTSGAESVRLRKLHNVTLSICEDIPCEIRDKENFKQALLHESQDILLNHLLSSIRELQAATNNFWLMHFSLAVNTIGFVKGSQGLPVDKLLSFAKDSMISENSLISVVANVGNYYDKTPEAYKVKMNNKDAVIGKSIYAHVQNEFKIKEEYSPPKTGNKALIDHFNLRELEPNDSGTSPYSKWFNPGQNLFFQSHSFGKPLNIFSESINKTSERLSNIGNDYWKLFFDKRMPQLQKTILDLLAIKQGFLVNIDANVTAIITRLLSTNKNKKYNILTTAEEFLAIKRIIASKKKYEHYNVTEVSIHPDRQNIANDIINAFNQSIDLIIMSQVTSNLQICFSESELEEIFDFIPNHLPIIVDITQGFCNVTINWGKLLKNRNNIYLVGSCIKHARSTSGLGFLVFPSENSTLSYPKDSGWCAYISGLTMTNTTNHEGELLYDNNFQWFGGTPANCFSVELFINTWDAIKRTGENIMSMNSYVNELQQHLISTISKDYAIIGLSRRETRNINNSCCLVLGYNKSNIEELIREAREENIYIDQRQGSVIRIGIGVQHGYHEINKLTKFLNKW